MITSIENNFYFCHQCILVEGWPDSGSFWFLRVFSSIVVYRRHQLYYCLCYCSFIEILIVVLNKKMLKLEKSAFDMAYQNIPLHRLEKSRVLTRLLSQMVITGDYTNQLVRVKAVKLGVPQASVY